MNEILTVVEKSLSDIYNTHKDKGMRSIYLHGSILSENFTEGISDVDAIAITDDTLPPETEAEINEGLKENLPSIHHFTVRFLYKSELDGGKVKGFIAKYIDPALLLFDLPNWKFVVGEKFTKDQFSLGTITIEDAICLRIKQIKRKASTLEESKDNYKYLIKAVARLCYLLQGAKTPFSYTSIKENSNEETKEIVDLILQLRNNKWDYQLFKTNLNIFEDFITNISTKHCDFNFT